MPTKAKPLRGATHRAGFQESFRLSTESRLALAAVGWTESMLADLDRRVEGARFDASFPEPTVLQVVAALESLARAADSLHSELESLDWLARHIVDVQIREHLSDLTPSGLDFRAKLTEETMALGVLIRAILRDAPKAKRGAPPKQLNNAVALIVRKIMVEHGQESMAEGGSTAVATTAVLRELGVLAADNARHPLRRTKKLR